MNPGSVTISHSAGTDLDLSEFDGATAKIVTSSTELNSGSIEFGNTKGTLTSGGIVTGGEVKAAEAPVADSTPVTEAADVAAAGAEAIEHSEIT